MSFINEQNIPSPDEVKDEVPFPRHLTGIKAKRDAELKDIISGKTDKFILIVGPCSASDEDAVCDYISRLAKINEEVKDKVFIIPRIYTNKPRTTGDGYKGMLHQPDPEKATNIYAGIIALRKMHIRALSESHLTAADEMLYPENLVYVDDMLGYITIGARSVENQQHRLVTSGINQPVGMKNPTSGFKGRSTARSSRINVSMNTWIPVFTLGELFKASTVSDREPSLVFPTLERCSCISSRSFV